MTDTSASLATKAKSGASKTGAAFIILEVAQHVNPLIVHWLSMKYPILGDTLCAEIVDFAEGGIGSLMVWLTPQHFADSVVDAMVFIKTTWLRCVAVFKSNPPT